MSYGTLSGAQAAKYRMTPHEVSPLGDLTSAGEHSFVGGSKALMGSQGAVQFKSKDVAGGRVFGLGAWNRGSAVDWEGTSSPTPGYQQQ